MSSARRTSHGDTSYRGTVSSTTASHTAHTGRRHGGHRGSTSSSRTSRRQERQARLAPYSSSLSPPSHVQQPLHVPQRVRANHTTARVPAPLPTPAPQSRQAQRPAPPPPAPAVPHADYSARVFAESVERAYGFGPQGFPGVGPGPNATYEQRAQFASRFLSALHGDDSSDDEDEGWDGFEEEEEARDRVGLLERISHRLPPHFQPSEVRASSLHRKACSQCGKKEWHQGELYFTDVIQPWGADKVCEECIEAWLNERFGMELDSEEEREIEEEEREWREMVHRGRHA